MSEELRRYIVFELVLRNLLKVDYKGMSLILSFMDTYLKGMEGGEDDDE